MLMNNHIKPKFALVANVKTREGNITYTVKAIIVEPEYNSVMYNDFDEYEGPHNLSFYESELELVKEPND